MYRPREATAGEALKRAFVVGVNPFAAFGDIVARPDSLGPVLCLLLFTITYTACDALVLSKVYLYTASGPLVRPQAYWVGDSLRVVEVNYTSLKRVGPPGEEHFALLNMLALGAGVSAWLAWTVGIWVAMKVVGGPPAPSALMGGYVLSFRFYEYLARLVTLLWFLSRVPKIEVIVAPQSATRPPELTLKLLSLTSLALASVAGLRTALWALTAFFTVWGVVVATAALKRGYEPMHKAVAGGLIAYLLSLLVQSLSQYLLILTLQPPRG